MRHKDMDKEQDCMAAQKPDQVFQMYSCQVHSLLRAVAPSHWAGGRRVLAGCTCQAGDDSGTKAGPLVPE